MKLRPAQDTEPDLAMAVMLAMWPGRSFTQQEIADVCGIQRGGIWTIEKRALRKLARKLELAGVGRAAEARLGSRQNPLRVS